MTDPIVIVSAVRTPMGGFQGDLKGLTAPQLGAAAIRAAVERAGARGFDSLDALLAGSDADIVAVLSWIKSQWAPETRRHQQ